MNRLVSSQPVSARAVQVLMIGLAGLATASCAGTSRSDQPAGSATSTTTAAATSRADQPAGSATSTTTAAATSPSPRRALAADDVRRLPWTATPPLVVVDSSRVMTPRGTYTLRSPSTVVDEVSGAFASGAAGLVALHSSHGRAAYSIDDGVPRPLGVDEGGHDDAKGNYPPTHSLQSGADVLAAGGDHGESIAIIGRDGSVRLLPNPNPEGIDVLPGQLTSDYVWGDTGDDQVARLDRAAPQRWQTLSPGLVVASSSSSVAVAATGSTLDIRDAASYALRWHTSLPADAGLVYASFSVDGSRIAVARGDLKTIWVRDAASGRLLWTIDGLRTQSQGRGAPPVLVWSGHDLVIRWAEHVGEDPDPIAWVSCDTAREVCGRLRLPVHRDTVVLPVLGD